MIDVVVYFLLEEFQKEGLRVPLGTIYRIAENMIAKQNEYVDGLICCKECKKRYNPNECPMCHLVFGERYECTSDNGYCDRGERRPNETD